MGHGNSGVKRAVISNPAKKNWVKFLQAGQKVKFSSFIAWFYLKDKLLEQKIDAEGSCPDTEEPWKVWGKTDSWFPIQSRKNCANSFQPGQKVKNSIFMAFFCFFWFNQKLWQDIYLVTLKRHENFWEKTDSWFPIQPKTKLGEISWSR